MDFVREALKRRNKGSTVKAVVRAVRKTNNPIVVPDPCPVELSLSDRLLAGYFMTHLDKEKAKDYLRNQSANVRKKLVMADLYAAAFGTRGLYDILDDPIHVNSWVAFLTNKLGKKIDDFVTGVYRGPEIVGKSAREQIAEDVLYQYVELDFSRYHRRIKMRDLNLVLLLDNLFRIEPGFREVGELREMVRQKKKQLADLVNSYNIDAGKEELNALYLLDGVRELKR